MKLMRLTFAAAFALAFTSAYAFHSGGVAECVGCHSMHSPAVGGSHLLVGTDQSSTCLTCHEHAGDTGPSSYHISTPNADLGAGISPIQRTPGGDFGWLRKTYSWPITNPDGTPGTDYEWGDHHGHNIVAADNGYAADAFNTAAPGGTFPAAQLACNSCHDPHGKYRRLTTGAIATAGAPIRASGSYNGANNEPNALGAVGVYRLLAGSGYTKDGVTYAGVPAAKVPSTYNQGEATSQIRVAYGNSGSANGHSTWGNWCGTCHPAMHSNGNYVHPVDQGMSGAIVTNYIQYVKSGDMTGVIGTAFSSLVPFVTNSGDYAALAALAANAPTSAGPQSGDQVSCLSCHRAHASAFPWGLRWQMEYEFMTVNSQYMGTDNASVTGPRRFIQNRGRVMAENAAGYYDRAPTQFATWQRVLCNKCHAKD